MMPQQHQFNPSNPNAYQFYNSSKDVMYFNTFLTINTLMRNSSFDNNWPVQAIQFQLPQSSSGGEGHRQDLRTLFSYVSVITINCYVFQNICNMCREYIFISIAFRSIDSSPIDAL